MTETILKMIRNVHASNVIGHKCLFCDEAYVSIEDVMERSPYVARNDPLEYVDEECWTQYYWSLVNASDKLKAAKIHLTEYPDVDGGICDDCPYPKERKTREGACGNCAIGKVKFWLQDHKNILEGEG